MKYDHESKPDNKPIKIEYKECYGLGDTIYHYPVCAKCGEPTYSEKVCAFVENH